MKNLARTRYAVDADVKQAVTYRPQTLDINTSILWSSHVYHLLSMCHVDWNVLVKMKWWISECLLTYFENEFLTKEDLNKYVLSEEAIQYNIISLLLYQILVCPAVITHFFSFLPCAHFKFTEADLCLITTHYSLHPLDPFKRSQRQQCL